MFLKSSFKKKLLLFLAAGLDYWDSHLSYGATKFRAYYGFYRKSTIFSTVSRLLSVGYIEKVVKNGEVYLRLTSKGSDKIKQDIPLFKYFNQRWDGYWRLVIFDIPEKRKVLRDVLRRKLVSLGLGRWQKSVYITPFNLEEEINQFLKTQKLFGLCFCIKGRKLGGGDDKEIAKIAFKLDKINRQYYQFIDEEIEKARFLLRNGRLKFKHVQLLVDKYLELILKDPGLPNELLPKVWWAEEAKKSFKDFIIDLRKKGIV